MKVNDSLCFKQKTAYEMRISDWSADVCSSDLIEFGNTRQHNGRLFPRRKVIQGRHDVPAIELGMIKQLRPVIHAVQIAQADGVCRGEQPEIRRSEERRGGKECVSPCGYRRSQHN